jgi:hypothetical protein
MTDKPRLIEVAFPLKQASLTSVHEKNVRHVGANQNPATGAQKNPATWKESFSSFQGVVLWPG